MKPHTRIIYYTLLCLALNHRRSKACIYGGMEREQALYVFLFAYLFALSMCVCLCACKCVHEYVFYRCRYVKLLYV